MEQWLDYPTLGAEEKLEIGRNIRRNRKESGLTQEALAWMIGIEPSMVSKHEKGKQLPEIKHLLRYAFALGCTLRDLFPREVGELVMSYQDPLVEKIQRLDERKRNEVINYIDYLTSKAS